MAFRAGPDAYVALAQRLHAIAATKVEDGERLSARRNRISTQGYPGSLLRSAEIFEKILHLGEEAGRLGLRLRR